MMVVKALKNLFIGCFLLVPLSFLVPKRKLVLFIGKNGGFFFDNTKYLYLYTQGLADRGAETVFFTEIEDVYRTLKELGLPAVKHPSLGSIWLMLRAKVVVSSSTTWKKGFKYHLLFWAKKVQLWHGLPLKRIGMTTAAVGNSHASYIGRFLNAIRGKNHRHDLFISTSLYFTENVFRKAFRARCFLDAGYPRNDIFFRAEPQKRDLVGSDLRIFQKMSELRNEGLRTILYAPTCRDPFGNAVACGPLNIRTLAVAAKQHNWVFVLKFHPSTSFDAIEELPDNILIVNPSADIQPLLTITDVLITDYSSVYMDYLLLDRPVVFFPYNYDEYIRKEGSLLFDYNELTPGPKCYTQEELLDNLERILGGGGDRYRMERQRIKSLAFEYYDGEASSRIWHFIRSRFI